MILKNNIFVQIIWAGFNLLSYMQILGINSNDWIEFIGAFLELISTSIHLVLLFLNFNFKFYFNF